MIVPLGNADFNAAAGPVRCRTIGPIVHHQDIGCMPVAHCDVHHPVGSPVMRFISALSLTRRMRMMGPDPLTIRRMPTAKITFPSVILDEAATDARSECRCVPTFIPSRCDETEDLVFKRMPRSGHMFLFCFLLTSRFCFCVVFVQVPPRRQRKSANVPLLKGNKKQPQHGLIRQNRPLS